MTGESEGGGGGGGGGTGDAARCVQCDLEYNRDDRCPRVLVCGHTCCTACLDGLINKDQKRCPTCNRYFFTLSVVLIPKNLDVLNGPEKSSKRSSVGSSVGSRSSYVSARSSLSTDSTNLEGMNEEASSKRSSLGSRSSYASARSSLSSDSNLGVMNGEQSSKRSSLGSSLGSRSSYISVRSSLSNDSTNLETMNGEESSKRSSLGSSLGSRSSYTSVRSSLSNDSSLEVLTGSSSQRSSLGSSLVSRSSYSSLRSSLSSNSGLEMMNGEESLKRSSVGSSLESRSSYSPVRSSLSSTSGLGSTSFEVTKSSEESSAQSSYLEEQSTSRSSTLSPKSSYSSPLRSSSSYDSASLETSKSPAKSSWRSSLTLDSTDLDMPQSSEKSSYSSPFKSSLSKDSGAPNTSERSSGPSEFWKPSLKSSYSSPFRSSSSSDSSSLQRPGSTGESSGISSLKSSLSLGSSFEAQENEGDKRGEGNVSESSSRVLSPPPVPSSAPPSLEESHEDLSTPGIRSQGIKDPSEEDGGGGREGQDGSNDGGASGHGSTRPSIPQRSSSADQDSGGSYTPPTYSFPTIRSKLNLSKKQESDAQGSSVSTAKMELRPVKSLPASSSSSSSPSSWSLPRLSSSLGQKEEASSSGYTSPFKKSSSSSSVSSIFSSRAARGLSRVTQKPALKDNAATDSEKVKDKTTSTSSSVSSILSPTAVRSLSSESQKSTLRDSSSTDSEKIKDTTSSVSYSLSSSYSSLVTPSLDSIDGTSLSQSLPSLHKLDAKLSAAPAKEKDEVDLGVSRWKMDTSSLLSRRTDAKDAAAGRVEGQDTAAPSSSRGSETPSHVLRMIRSVTSKTRPAAGATDEVTTSFSSSFSSSSLTNSKDTHTPHEADQPKPRAAATEASQTSAASVAPEAGTVTPTSVRDVAGGSVSPPGRPPLSSDGDVRDASEGRGDVVVLGGEAEAARHSSTSTPPTESRSEELQASRKLTPSASLRARLGMRTRFLATAIDEAGEEEHAGGGEPSTGEQQSLAGREDKLYTAARQGGEESARPRLSLGARISARAGYLSGGRGSGGGGESSGEVQAEDSTKIDLQRRAGRAATKSEVSAGGSDGGPGQGGGAAGPHLAATGAATAGVEEESRPSGPAQERRPSVPGDAGAPEGDGAPPGSESSGHDDPRPEQWGSAAPAQESSQHTRWRRHRPIDSRAKEELSDPGCVPRAAADHGPAGTSTGLPEAPGASTFPPEAPPATNSVSTASPAHLGQHGAAVEPRSPHHRWTKSNDTSEGPPPGFRSEAGSVGDTSAAAEGRPGTGGGRGGEDTRTPPPLPPSGPFPWRKRWRSVTEHTSSAAARHSPPEANKAALSGASQQPEQQPPSGPAPPDKAQEGTGGDETLARPSYRAALGALAIGRVPSVQEPEGDAGDGGNKAAGRGEGLDVARMRLRRTTEDTPQDTPQDTTEDINTRLRRARERLRATVAPPTEEPPCSPARSNLTYLLTRVQSSEAVTRPPRVTSLSDGDDEVFEDSAAEAHGDQHVNQPEIPSAASLDRGPEAGGPERFSSSISAHVEGDSHGSTTDEVDSVTRRRNTQNDRMGQESRDMESWKERHDGEPQRRELSDEATHLRQRNDPRRQKFFEEMQHTEPQEPDEAPGMDEDTPDAPYEAPTQIVNDSLADYPYEAPQIVYETGDTEDGEYEPGVGLCSSHGQMMNLYCQECGEWVCKDCLKVLHRPQPHGSCQVISAAEGVNQIKLTNSSFLTARTNTLEYFKEELRRIINECTGSIHLHRDNIRRLEAQIEEDRRLLRGIKSMRNLAKEKRKQVDYWEEVLRDNLSRIDESSTSQDVIRAVQETSGDILRKAMEAVSHEAGAGVLLSPPPEY